MPKLLIVDEAALRRKPVRLIFEETGLCEVRTARNGRDALDQLGAVSYTHLTLPTILLV